MHRPPRRGKAFASEFLHESERVLFASRFCRAVAALIAAGCGGERRLRATLDDGVGRGLHARPARHGHRRQAHRRHRQARPTRPTSRTTTRPTARASRAPSPTRSPTSSATTRPTSSGSTEPFNSSYAPGPEGLRLRRQPDLDHAEARRAGRLLVALLRGRPGRRRAQGLRRGRRDLARRPPGRLDRRPDRDDEPRRGQRLDPAERGAEGLQHSNDVVTALKQGQVDAIVVDVPTAFYLTATQVPEADDRRPVPGPGRRRVGRPAREGLAAHRLRLVRDRRAQLVGRAARRSRSSG